MFKDMAFEEALYYVRRGRIAARAGWNGEKSIYRDDETIMEKYVAGNLEWVWEPKSADLLTKDWCIL